MSRTKKNTIPERDLNRPVLISRKIVCCGSTEEKRIYEGDKIECVSCGKAFQMFPEHIISGVDDYIICPACRKAVHAFFYADKYGERGSEVTYDELKVYKEGEQ